MFSHAHVVNSVYVNLEAIWLKTFNDETFFDKFPVSKRFKQKQTAQK